MWVKYVHWSWHSTRKFVVLEIKLPQETVKSPAAMELALHSLIQTGGESTAWDIFWLGKTRPWASLEIAVIGGEVRFFIWCFEGQKTAISSALYAQYPDIAIYETEDYTKEVSQNRDKYDVWACQYFLTDRTHALPIKTYIDYGLSEDPDEEFKVDPLAQLIEVLGTADKEDQIWFQFLVRAHIDEKLPLGMKIKSKWMDDAKKEIQKVIDSASTERIDVNEEGKVKKTLTPVTAKMTTEKKDRIDAIARSIGKFPLDVGVRAIQVYPKGEKGHIRRDVIKSAFRQFGASNRNNLRPDDQDYNHWWQDPSYAFPFFRRFLAPRNQRLGEHIFRCYCLRSYFYYPYVPGPHIPLMPWGVKYKNKPNQIMNTEALATLFHFPGSTAKAPALHRIPSKSSDAPSNLPT